MENFLNQNFLIDETPGESQIKNGDNTISYSTNPFEIWKPFSEMYNAEDLYMRSNSAFCGPQLDELKIEDISPRRKPQSVDVCIHASFDSEDLPIFNFGDDGNEADKESKHEGDNENANSSNMSTTSNSKTRWKFEQDVLLVKVLKELLPSTNITGRDLMKGKGRMSIQFKQLMTACKQKAEWKGTIYELRSRISKKLNRTKFTAREERKVKRLLRLYLDGQINLELLLESFPWKSQEQIFQYCI
jgi:hypothetical protein